MNCSKIFCLISLILANICQSNAQSVLDSLAIELENHYQTSNLPGFAVSLITQEKVLYCQGFGYADVQQKKPFTPHTIQNVGSVSKTVVGMALVMAIKQGKLSMDTPINEVLNFTITNPYFKKSPIKIRHLANHTSSIVDTRFYGRSYIQEKPNQPLQNVEADFLNFIKGHKKISLEQFLKNILTKKGKWYSRKNFLKSKPGAHAEYSNLNAALMAYIIEVATQTDFRVYTQKHIFTPLKMKVTSWSPQPLLKKKQATRYFPNGKIVPAYTLITYPDGGLYTSVTDINLYLQEVIKAFDDKSNYLTPLLRKLMLPGDGDQNRAFWGMGVKSRNIGHGGSDPGVQTDMQFNADRKIGRVIFTNVNAEDNEKLWKQYEKIHAILYKYEMKLAQN